METKIKTREGGGFEIDGVVYDRLQDAQQHLRFLLEGDDRQPAWLGQRIEYKFDSETAKSFGVFIHGLLEQKSLTMTQLAKAIGVARKTIYSWMDAQTMPEDSQIETISNFAGVTLDEVRVTLADNFFHKNDAFIRALSISSRDIQLIKEAATKIADEVQKQQVLSIQDAIQNLFVFDAGIMKTLITTLNSFDVGLLRLTSWEIDHHKPEIDSGLLNPEESQSQFELKNPAQNTLSHTHSAALLKAMVFAKFRQDQQLRFQNDEELVIAKRK